MIDLLPRLCLLMGLAVAFSCAGEAAAVGTGLVGDGRADDTAALQAAIDEADGAVVLPKGTYRITQPLVLDLDGIGLSSISGNGVATLLMDGPGPAVRIVGTHFKSADPEGFEDRVWTRQRMPLIDGIGIAGGHEEADGIHAVGTMQLTISRVQIRGCRHGIRLLENNRNVVISDCHLYENAGIGIFYDDVNLHQSNITGCHISYNAGGGLVCRKGNIRNLHVTGCDLESNMGADQPPTANVLIDSRESPFGTAEVAITGCTIQHNRRAAGSANIRIIGRSDGGEAMQREGHVTITGNILSDVFVNVHLQDCRGVTLTGNTLWMGFDHNLLIERCQSIVVGPNSLDRNPRYRSRQGPQPVNDVVFRDCEDCTITGLHVTKVLGAAAAVTVADCRRMHIANCTILDSEAVGLALIDLVDSRVSGIFVRRDHETTTAPPVRIEGGRGNQLDRELLDYR